MPVPRRDVLRLFVVVLFGVIISASSDRPARAACDFAPVKQQIDIVLDRDHERGARFRREVASGSDSIAAMEALVSAEMREKIDTCRYDVAEYLTRRGFPPFH
jgi:hypothetical protein